MLKAFTFKSWLVALLTAGLVIFAVGCSDDDDDDGPIVTYGPDLLLPANGANLDLAANEDVFEWDETSADDVYLIQIAGDAGFAASAIVIESDVDTNYYEAQTNKLIIGAEHFWRVAMYDGTELGDWSRVRSFTPTATPITVDEILTGEILTDKTLETGKTYLLRAGVFVGKDDASISPVLTIEPGVTIYGESATDGMLVIRRGAQINAVGTSSQPIVFTSDKSSRSRGDWGGVIINGQASLNTGSEAFGEGDTGPYGGNIDTDNSGTMRYVRIEFAGREISPDNELNGLALQGVGSGTTLDHIQIHMNKDDGIEFFGGTVEAKYLYVTGCSDDQFDWTDGWRGKGQFWVAQQYGDDADQGIEADNNGDDNSASPFSHPTIYNITLVGDKQGEESDIGMLLREGTQANIYNAIVMNFGDCGIDIDHETTFANAWSNDGLSGALTVDYSIFYENESTWQTDEDDEATFDFTSEEFISTLNANNSLAVDPELTNPLSRLAPDFTPVAGGLAATKEAKAVPVDDFFEDVNFIGAVDPSANWLAGWTTDAQN